MNIFANDTRDNSLPVLSIWKGKWIWIEEKGDGKHDYICFRKEFLLDEKIQDPVIHITAEQEYVFWINGNFVDRGPTLSDPRYKRYDSFRIKHLLSTGINTIAILVYHHNEAQGSRRLIPYQESRGMLCQIDDEDRTLLISDENWKTARHKGWLKPTTHFDDSTYPEWYSACNFSAEWNKLGFDSSSWEQTVNCISEKNPTWGSAQPQNRFFPWTNLIPSEIRRPKLIKHTPVKVDTGEVLQRREFSFNDAAVRMSLEKVMPCSKALVSDAESLMRNFKATVKVRNSDYLEPEETFDGLRNATIIIDFGRLMNSRFGFKMKSPGNVKIDIGYAWKLEEERIMPYVSSRTPQADCYITKEGTQEWQTFQWRHFRYVQITFRDLMETLELLEVWAEEVEYQFSEDAVFSSSCELLDYSWKATGNTIKLCCSDQTMDNPSRERKQYLGDCSSAVPVVDHLFGETALIKKYFHQFDESQHRTGLYRYSTGHDDDGASLFDHSLSLPIRLYEHYMRFGDNELISRMMPGIMRFMVLCESILDSKGIAMLPPYGIWFDWAEVKRENTSFILNAMVAKAFYAVSQLIKWTDGENEDSIKFGNKSAHIFQFLRNNFYDSERKVYVDCFKDDGTMDPFVSEHTNSLAVIWGIASVEQADGIMNTYASNRKLFSAASPAWGYLPEAFAHAHRIDLVMDWLQRKYKPVFDAGYNTLPETWCLYAENTLGYWRCRDSRAVAQSAGLGLPSAVINSIAGIIPVEPRFRKLRISPKLGKLKHFSIALPGPDGIYELQYSNTCSEKIYKIKIPAQKKCEFIINEQDLPRNVIINGRKSLPESVNKTFNNETLLSFNLGSLSKDNQWEIIENKGQT